MLQLNRAITKSQSSIDKEAEQRSRRNSTVANPPPFSLPLSTASSSTAAASSTSNMTVAGTPCSADASTPGAFDDCSVSLDQQQTTSSSVNSTAQPINGLMSTSGGDTASTGSGSRRSRTGTTGRISIFFGKVNGKKAKIADVTLQLLLRVSFGAWRMTGK
uniref:Uncharacterized protein n=1 Tax=Plectus sambesii TaxID=2011161 RepID=A0A914V6B3_9BILA